MPDWMPTTGWSFQRLCQTADLRLTVRTAVKLGESGDHRFSIHRALVYRQQKRRTVAIGLFYGHVEVNFMVKTSKKAVNYTDCDSDSTVSWRGITWPKTSRGRVI